MDVYDVTDGSQAAVATMLTDGGPPPRPARTSRATSSSTRPAARSTCCASRSARTRLCGSPALRRGSTRASSRPASSWPGTRCTSGGRVESRSSRCVRFDWGRDERRRPRRAGLGFHRCPTFRPWNTAAGETETRRHETNPLPSEHGRTGGSRPRRGCPLRGARARALGCQCGRRRDLHEQPRRRRRPVRGEHGRDRADPAHQRALRRIRPSPVAGRQAHPLPWR